MGWKPWLVCQNIRYHNRYSITQAMDGTLLHSPCIGVHNTFPWCERNRSRMYFFQLQLMRNDNVSWTWWNMFVLCVLCSFMLTLDMYWICPRFTSCFDALCKTALRYMYLYVWIVLLLAHCGLVTPYGVKKTWSTLVYIAAWCCQTPRHYMNHCWIISSEVFHLRAISHEVLKMSIPLDVSFKITNITLQPYLMS